MRYQQLPVDSLVPYARNARTHSAAQIEHLAAAIEEFGFLNPVVVTAAGGILAGHGRVLAAKRLGMATVPCIRADHLSEPQQRAYILADNRITEMGGWDDEMLRAELVDLGELGVDLDITGFDLDLDDNDEPTPAPDPEPPQGIRVPIMIETTRGDYKRFGEWKKRLGTKDNAAALAALLEIASV